MTKQEKKERTDLIKTWGIGILIALGIFYLLQLTFGDYIRELFGALNSVLVPASISIFMVYLVDPLYRFILKIFKKKQLSATLSVFIFVLIVLGFFSLIGFILTDQLIIIVQRIEGNWSDISAFLNSPSILSILPTAMKNSAGTEVDFQRTLSFLSSFFIGDFENNLFPTTFNLLNNISHWMLIVTLVPVFLYFFLLDGDKIFKFASSLVPRKFFREEATSIALIANQSTGKYIRGKMLSILALSIIFFFAFSIIFITFNKLPLMTAILYALLFAIIISLLDLVPFVGPFIGITLPIGLVLVLSNTNIEFFIYAGALIVSNGIAQEIQKAFIEPTIMSKEVNLHPVGVLMGFLFFGALFGFAGFILATPLVATIHSTRLYFIKKHEDEEEEEKKISEVVPIENESQK
jgi:putative permease